MEMTLPLETLKLEMDGEEIVWPKSISDECYTLVYTHSNLMLNKHKPKLHQSTLYEAWAFNGKQSWHIWNLDGEWVCTLYDTEKDDATLLIRREQLLLKHFADTIKKKKLVIYERMAYDEDNQAYIAYACPIGLSD